VGLGGLEPPTLRLSGVRSNHLSYRPSNQDGGSDSNRQTLHEPSKSKTLAPSKPDSKPNCFCENVDLVTWTSPKARLVPRAEAEASTRQPWSP
jgi:hypothetical protein